MRKLLLLIATTILLTSCEKVLFNEEDVKPKGNLTITFEPSFRTTRAPMMRTRAASINLADYCDKINLMLFDKDGNKAFDKVKTQLKEDNPDFNTFTLSVPEGTYTVVATAHSSIKSATIKSPQMVQFTASNGEKLTDTFSYCGDVVVTEDPQSYTLSMDRVAAMFRLILTDESMPEQVAKIKFDYTGGSANYNPSTMQGCTKSTQSELRSISSQNVYEVYTFPYMADTCYLKMTVSALDASENILVKKTVEKAKMKRNKVSQFTGVLFSEDPNSIQPCSIGFTVNGEWEGTDDYEF